MLIGDKRSDILRPLDETDAIPFDILVEAKLDILVLEAISVDVV